MKTPTEPDSELAGLPPDPDAPASDEERRAADELRDALADATRPDDDAALARALVLAYRPRPLGGAENAALVERALARPAAPVLFVAQVHVRRARTRWLVGAGVSTLALAAAALVFQAQETPVAMTVDTAASLPARARSAQPLFHEPFAAYGGTSSRVDRIASARAADLRENMFARWDVR